jgi:hypothetical protein
MIVLVRQTRLLHRALRFVTIPLETNNSSAFFGAGAPPAQTFVNLGEI